MGKTIIIAGLDMSHDWVEIYTGHLECSKCGVFQAEDAPPVGYPCPENGKATVAATTRPMEYGDITAHYDQLDPNRETAKTEVKNPEKEALEVEARCVDLAEEGTIMAEFQTERTAALSEMFDNVGTAGIHPTTELFVRLDNALAKALSRQKQIQGKAYLHDREALKVKRGHVAKVVFESGDKRVELDVDQVDFHSDPIRWTIDGKSDMKAGSVNEITIKSKVTAGVLNKLSHAGSGKLTVRTLDNDMYAGQAYVSDVASEFCVGYFLSLHTFRSRDGFLHSRVAESSEASQDEETEGEGTAREHPLLCAFKKAIEDGRPRDLLTDRGWEFRNKILCKLDSQGGLAFEDCDRKGRWRVKLSHIIGIRSHRSEKEESAWIVVSDPLMQNTADANISTPEFTIESVDLDLEAIGKPEYIVRCNEDGRKALHALPRLLRSAKAILEEELSDDRSKDKEMFAKMDALKEALSDVGIEI